MTPIIFPSTVDLLNMMEYKLISWVDQNSLRICEISLKVSVYQHAHSRAHKLWGRDTGSPQELTSREPYTQGPPDAWPAFLEHGYCEG